jgi:transposase
MQEGDLTMNSILYVGLDVHTTNYTICTYEAEFDRISREVQVAPDYRNIQKYINKLRQDKGATRKVICGYEAGCLGYSLYRQLTAVDIDCVILAPTTMERPVSYQIKNDKRDAKGVARCLATNGYSEVYVPTPEDESVKEYIRMRDDHMDDLKRIKQRMMALCTRQGKRFTEGKQYWTQKHLEWLRKLDLGNTQLNQTLSEYIETYYWLNEKVERLDRQIEEISIQKEYEERVKKLICFLGIRKHTALSMLVEVGDFKRFPNADHFAAYLGLVPGENSSSNRQRFLGITKAGNKHLRRLLIEAAQSYSHGAPGYKSRILTTKQKGNPPEVIAYADKANARLRRKYYNMLFKEKKHNVIVAAIARELACFIWGMMTERIA